MSVPLHRSTISAPQSVPPFTVSGGPVPVIWDVENFQDTAFSEFLTLNAQGEYVAVRDHVLSGTLNIEWRAAEPSDEALHTGWRALSVWVDGDSIQSRLDSTERPYEFEVIRQTVSFTFPVNAGQVVTFRVNHDNNQPILLLASAHTSVTLKIEDDRSGSNLLALDIVGNPVVVNLGEGTVLGDLVDAVDGGTGGLLGGLLGTVEGLLQDSLDAVI